MAEDELDAAARLRFGRQIRLAEIGVSGQLELRRARIAPGAVGDAERVESLYLAASGVGLAAPEPTATPPEVAEVLAALDLAHPAARDAAEGALRALAAMRAVLRIA